MRVDVDTVSFQNDAPRCADKIPFAYGGIRRREIVQQRYQSGIVFDENMAVAIFAIGLFEIDDQSSYVERNAGQRGFHHADRPYAFRAADSLRCADIMRGKSGASKGGKDGRERFHMPQNIMLLRMKSGMFRWMMPLRS